MMIRIQTHFISQALFLLLLHAACFALPAKTLVLCDDTIDSMSPIEDIELKNKLVSFDAAAPGTVHETFLCEKKSIDAASFVEIKTPYGSVLLGEEQEVFDIATGKFIQAGSLTPQSVLWSRIHGDVRCNEIIVQQQLTPCFKISLDPLDLFFVTELQLLMHNIAPAVTILPALTKFFAEAAIIATGTIAGAMTFYTNLDLGKNQALKTLDSFATSHAKKPPAMTTMFIPHQKNPAPISGIALDETVYNQIRQMPYIHSSLVMTAQMNATGDVTCRLWAVKYAGCKDKVNQYQPVEVGGSTLPRTHETVKNFIKDEDTKKINELRDAAKKWPATVTSTLFKKGNVALEVDLINKIGLFDKTVYGLTFGPHAIQNMVNKNIAPSEVLHVLHHGKVTRAYNPEWIIVIEEKANIAVVIDQTSKKIVNVGRYKTDMGQLNQEVKDDVEKAMTNENKKTHILQKKHNWNQFDPDPEKNWDKIIKAIKETLKNGHHWKEKNNQWRASKALGEHIIVVAYSIKDGIRLLGTAWVTK